MRCISVPMYAAEIRTLRTEETERIRLDMNHILDIYIPEAILDCIRDLDKDLKAKAVSNILDERGGSFQGSCSYDLLSKYIKLANVSHEGFISLVQNHGGIKTFEASLKEYFSGFKIRVALTRYKTILVCATL